MRLNYSFEMVDMGDDIIAVPVGKKANEVKGVIKLNKEGKKIFKFLEEETTESDIVKTLSSEYENSNEELVKYVHEVIETLRTAKLLSE